MFEDLHMVHILMQNGMMVKDASFDLSDYSSTRTGYITSKSMEPCPNGNYVHLVVQIRGSKICNITSSEITLACTETPSDRIRFTPKLDMGKYKRIE